MVQKTDLNVSPYYDDFDETDNFHRTLFRPGFAIQARELTQLQSVLQNQIEKHGSHIFQEGTVVIPGSINFPENWMTVNGGGAFRPASELKELYQITGVNQEGHQITFCNTGHWASLGWFVSHELVGNKQSKMYDGSMLEWSADKSLPMEQKIKLN